MKYLLFLCVILACCLGCSDKVQVSGKVVFTDGTPLMTGTVVFDNGRDQAKGRISEDGTYRLSSLKDNDGIVPGEYGVYVTGAVDRSLGTMPQGSIPIPRDLINIKFTSKATSGLHCTVKGTTVFDIEVTPPEKKL